MDGVLKDLVSGPGCAVDGSATARNPLSTVMNQMLEAVNPAALGAGGAAVSGRPAELYRMRPSEPRGPPPPPSAASGGRAGVAVAAPVPPSAAHHDAMSAAWGPGPAGPVVVDGGDGGGGGGGGGAMMARPPPPMPVHMMGPGHHPGMMGMGMGMGAMPFNGGMGMGMGMSPYGGMAGRWGGPRPPMPQATMSRPAPAATATATPVEAPAVEAAAPAVTAEPVTAAPEAATASNAPSADDQDAMRRASAAIAEALRGVQDDRFSGSQFVDMMDRIARGELAVDGDGLRASSPTGAPPQAATEPPPGMFRTSTGNYRLGERESNPFVDHPDAFRQGCEYFKEGLLKEAIQLFQAAIHQNPQHAEAWRMLGQSHAENDEDKQAIVCLEKAVEEDPYNLDALVALGVSYVNELNHGKALRTLQAWVQHHPKFHGLKVDVDPYSDGSLQDDVMQLMLKAAQWDSADPQVHVVLGVLYNVSKDFDCAVDSFRKALEAMPGDYSLWNKLGATLANHERSEEALPCYVRALSKKPNYARGWLNAGISFANVGDYIESARAYLQALKLNPDAVHIWSYLRIVFTCMERYDLARETTKRDVDALLKELGPSTMLTGGAGAALGLEPGMGSAGAGAGAAP